MEEFPAELGCWIEEGYNNVAPRAKQYLGLRQYEERRPTINATFLFNGEAETTQFLEWWVGYMNYGSYSCSVQIPFFGIKPMEVKMINDLQIDKRDDRYEATFYLEVQQTLAESAEPNVEYIINHGLAT